MDLERLSLALMFVREEFVRHIRNFNIQCSEYQHQYNIRQNEFPHPLEVDRRHLIFPHNTIHWNERKFEETYSGCFKRFEEFDHPLSVPSHPYNTNPRREHIETRSRRRLRHHLDDIYLPNYDDDSPRRHVTSRHHLRSRSHWKNRYNGGKVYRKLRIPQFKAIESRGATRSNVNSDTSLIGVDDQDKDIKSSLVDLKVDKGMGDERTVDINSSMRGIINDVPNKDTVEDIVQRSLTSSIIINLDSDTETICLDESGHTVPSNDSLHWSNGSTSNIKRKHYSKQRTEKKERRNNTINEPEGSIKRHFNQSIIDRKGKETVNNNEKGLVRREDPKNSPTISVSAVQSSDTNELSPKNQSLPTAKFERKYLNSKHSKNVAVEIDPHLHDPRLLKKKKPEISIYLETLHYKSVSVLNKKTDEKNCIEEPDGLHFKPKMNQNENGPIQLPEVANPHKSDKNERNDPCCSNTLGLVQSYRKDFNPKMNLTQISNYRREVSGIKGRKDEKTKTTFIASESRAVKKRRQVSIKNRKLVCQYNHYVLNKFRKGSLSKLNFCCHVVIHRAECDRYIESMKHTTNLLDLIDTRKSYLPRNNIRHIEKWKNIELIENRSIGNGLTEVMNISVSGKAKKETSCDQSELDEELMFLAERAKETVGKGSHTILKRKETYVEPGKVESKPLPKELFMRIYETKPIKVSGSKTDKVAKKNDTSLYISNSGKDKEKMKCSIKFNVSNRRTVKQLYDPRNDCKVGEDKLIEIFGDDLSDVTSVDIKSVKRKSVDAVECSTGSNLSKKFKESTVSEKKRATSYKRMSLTCEDVIVPSKKISKRRSTIHFSSTSDNTNTARQHIAPVVSCDSSYAAETIQLISEEILMTNTTSNVIHFKETEIPKNTSEDIVNILSEPEITSISQQKTSDMWKNGNDVANLNSSSTYFGLPDILSENISEKTKVMSTPVIKYQRADARVVEHELIETVEMETRDVLVEPFIDLTSDDKCRENFCNVVITNVSTNVSSRVEVKSESDEELLVQIRIAENPLYHKEIKQEIFSICELLGDVKREEIGENYLKELPLKFATSTKEEDEFLEECEEYFQHPTVELVLAISSVEQEHFSKAEFNLTTVSSSLQKISIDNEKAKDPSVSVSSSMQQVFPEKNMIHHIHSCSLLMIQQIYQRFYVHVYEILRGYIPLQRAYSGAYQLICGTLRKFPHPLNNFNYEDVSLHLIIFDRRKYYGCLLLRDILKLPHNLPHFDFCDFLRRTMEFLNKASITVSVPNLVEYLLELMIVYDYQYKQNRTSDKFKKNIESSLDGFAKKNGFLQTEFGLTPRQRALLRTQILTYLHLNSNQLVDLKNGKHFSPLIHSSQNFNLNTKFVNLSTVDGSLNKISNLVHQAVPTPLKQTKCIISNSAPKQSPGQNMSHSGIRKATNYQEMCHRTIEDMRTKKTTKPITQATILNTILNTPFNAQHITPNTCVPTAIRPPSYEYSVKSRDPITIRQASSINCHQNIPNDYSPNVNAVHTINLRGTQMVENHLNINTPVSVSSNSNITVSYTNRVTPSKTVEDNLSKTKCVPLSNLMFIDTSITKTVKDKFSAKAPFSASNVISNADVGAIMNRQSNLNTSERCLGNQLHSTSANALLDNISTSSFSVRSNTNEATSVTSGSLMNKSATAYHSNLPIIHHTENRPLGNTTKSFSVRDSTKVVSSATCGIALNRSTTSAHANLAMTQQIENGLLLNIPTKSFLVQDKTEVITSATSGSSLNRSTTSAHTNLPLTRPNENILAKILTFPVKDNTKLITSTTCDSSSSKPTMAHSNLRIIPLIENTQFANNRTSCLSLLKNTKVVTTTTSVYSLSKSQAASTNMTNTIISMTRTFGNKSVDNPSVPKTPAAVVVTTRQSPSACGQESVSFSHTGSSVTQSLEHDSLIDKPTSDLLVVNQLQPTHTVRTEASPTIIFDNHEKALEQNESPVGIHNVADGKSLAASSLDPYSIDLTSPPVGIKGEEVETREGFEDEVIDLTWMDDFTEEELGKDDHKNEFMFIKMEPLDDPAVPPSPGDSGIDSPPIQVDSNNFEASCRSVRVEEEDYPYFFSYQFE